YRLGCCFKLVAKRTASRLEFGALPLVAIDLGADRSDAAVALLEQRQRLPVRLVDAAEDVAATEELESQPGELLEELASRHVDLDQLVVGSAQVDVEPPGALLLLPDGPRDRVEGCAPAHLSHWYTPFLAWVSP